MGSHHYLHTIFLYDKIAKVRYIGAWWIADDHPSGEVNNCCAILLHFLRGIFDIAARATIAGCISYNLHIL